MSFRLKVYQIVRQIPPGRVATYGQVAALAGAPGAHRACGSALRHLIEGEDVPWHRVLNAQGKASSVGDPVRPLLQRRLLEGEGVRFSRGGRCDLEVFGWEIRA